MSPPASSGVEVASGVVVGILFFPVFMLLSYSLLSAIPFLRNSTAAIYADPAVAVGLALGLYFGTRRRFRAFARAFGWTTLGTLAVALGALALCYAVFRGV